MCINYVSIISNSKSLHKSLFIEALRPRLFANHVFPRCAMGPLPARHTCQGAAESQAVFSDNHCKLFKLSQTHHPTRTSLAPHRSCFLSVTYRGSNKAFLCLLCYLLCSTDQGKGYLSRPSPHMWPQGQDGLHVTAVVPQMWLAYWGIVGLCRDSFLMETGQESNPIKLNHHFQKYTLAPTRNNLQQLTHNEPIWNSSSNLIKL